MASVRPPLERLVLECALATLLKHLEAVEGQKRKLKHVVYSDGSLGLQGCMQMLLSLISKNQKVCSQHNQRLSPVRPTRETCKCQLLRQSCFRPQAPANKSTFPAWLTEVRDVRGLWKDKKENSSMWSTVMGLWACKAACKCYFH